MSNYSKNLSGLADEKVFVGNATAYASATTLESFIGTGSEGQIGVYLSSGALQTTALSAGDEFVIVQMRDGLLNKTPLLKWNDVVSSRFVDYVAPVRQISSIGYNGTAGDLSFNFTGASSTNAQTYGISVRELTPGNQPFPIQEGYGMVTSTTQDEYTLLASIVSQLNGDFDYERVQPDRFVKAEILSNGALTEYTANPTVTNGSVTVTFSANQTIATGTYASFRSAIYKVAVGVTAGTVITLDRPYQGATETIDVSTTVNAAAAMAYTSGTNLLGVRFTGLTDETIFKIAGNSLLTGDTVTALTAWVFGAGSGAQVVQMEDQGQIFDGPGSTVNAAFKADYGQPTKFASATGTYDQFYLDLQTKTFPAAALPTYSQTQIERIHLAVPGSGTSPTAQLQIVFGS